MVSNGFLDDDLVDRIHEASVVPSLWPDVLRRFVKVAEGREGALIATNGDWFKWICSSPAAEKLASDHYSMAGGDERSRRLMRLGRPGFVSDFDVFSEEEMRTLPLFRDLLLPSGYGRSVATAIPLPTGETVILHSEGDLALGPISRALIDRLDALRPHVARSAMVSTRLAFERNRTAVETLAGIGLAACAVSQSGKVLVANTYFDTLAAHLTTRAGDRIALLDSRAERQLASSLRRISTNAGVRSIALPATEQSRPAVLHVVPVRRSAHDLFSLASAILVLTTASREVVQNISLLQALFDFTPAEASIAARIAAGHTVGEIADSDGKSAETVRNQLKSVLAKSGCRRQLDLGRLLTSLVPNAGGGEP